LTQSHVDSFSALLILSGSHPVRVTEKNEKYALAYCTFEKNVNFNQNCSFLFNLQQKTFFGFTSFGQKTFGQNPFCQKTNGTARIRHQCRKTAVLSCHRFLISSCV
jgi:hypothetical protein